MTDIPIAVNRAELLADRVAENARNGTHFSIGKVMKEVGYSDGTTLNPSKITVGDAYKRRLELQNQRTAKEMAKVRKQALKLMLEKADEAKYRDLAYSADIMTKNERLLTGQSTENNAVQGSIIVLPSSDTDLEQFNNGSTEPV